MTVEPDILTSTLFEGLNEPQVAAVRSTHGPLMVLAGAGSGKTRMLTSRIAYLVESGLARPWEILAVTFTNKAAQEMRERVLRLLGQDPERVSRFRSDIPEVGTFHSVCVNILRRELQHTPFKQPFIIFDDSDQLTLLKGVVKRLDLNDKQFAPKAFQYAIDRLKCDAVEPHEFSPRSTSSFERHLQTVYFEYQRDLIAHGGIDFGEILCMTYRLLRDRPELRERYQRRFRYIHVDEYQDTNRAQYLLLLELASPDRGGTGNLCVVGDEDQSIYKWRGADIQNILNFESDFPGCRVVKLEQNYRSTENIISAASEVISNNQQRHAKKLWTANEPGAPIYLMSVPDDRAEADVLVSELKRLARSEGYSLSEFAIFYRTHAQSRQIEDVLRREKLNYKIVGGIRFYDRKEVKDILAYFRVISNPADNLSLKRALTSPARGIGKATLERVEAFARASQLTMWETLEIVLFGSGTDLVIRGSKKLLTAFQQLKNWRERRMQLSLGDLYHLILDETQYVQNLKEENTVEAESRIENLEELDALILEFEEDYKTNPNRTETHSMLEIFLEQVTLASEIVSETNPGIDQSTVKLMTLHSSKGLEFPVVFLVGMEEGLFPSIRGAEDGNEAELAIEEERRLFYVGMTRARRRLYLLHAETRRIWGQFHFQEPSRFLAEIPSALMERLDLTRRGPAESRADLVWSRGFRRDQ